ncbi:Rv1733c family protein [Nocardia anaemiae]|uniref:Rv1733c family protein n=1 Tax=Nocardia anaemiae TaxID=263910 RepID=UPI0007A4AE7C|nr:hypothetical protein [Nocardia anaemiae]
MSDSVTIPLQGWRTRLFGVWWLRPWNSNPLMRSSDRVEAAVRIIAVVAVLVAVPVAGALGTEAYTADVARIHTEQATKSVVNAVITDEPQRTSEHGVEARVQWQQNERIDTATVPVPRQAQPGDRVAVWLGPDGAPTTRPRQADAAPITGIGVGVIVLVGTGFVGLCLVRGTQWLLDRRRGTRWDREWVSRTIKEDRQ